MGELYPFASGDQDPSRRQRDHSKKTYESQIARQAVTTDGAMDWLGEDLIAAVPRQVGLGGWRKGSHRLPLRRVGSRNLSVNRRVSRTVKHATKSPDFRDSDSYLVAFMYYATFPREI